MGPELLDDLDELLGGPPLIREHEDQIVGLGGIDEPMKGMGSNAKGRLRGFPEPLDDYVSSAAKEGGVPQVMERGRRIV